MSVICKPALAAAMLLSFASLSHAEEANRYDRKLERATAARVATKIGDLRGAIRPEVRDYLYSENAAPAMPVPGFPIIQEPVKEDASVKLPPLVMVKPKADASIPVGPPYWDRL